MAGVRNDSGAGSDRDDAAAPAATPPVLRVSPHVSSARIDRLLHTSDGYIPASPTSPQRPLAVPAPLVPPGPPAPATRVASPPPRRGLSATPTPDHPQRATRSITAPSLQDTLDDLRILLTGLRRVLPLGGHVTRRLPRLIVHLFRSSVKQAAIMLHRRNLMASNVTYDIAILLWRLIINLFFREIRPRGEHKIPKDGPIIFVAAPHHNQFLDPLLLMSEVRNASTRRISFLIAEKSMKRAFVGFAARLMQSIPVVRAADDAKSGKGKIHLSSDLTCAPGEATTVYGIGTAFMKEFAPKKQIMLSKSLAFATAEIIQVVSDTECVIKKGFGRRGGEGLAEAAEHGLSYKILPHIDQSRMYGKVYDRLKEGGCLGIFPEGGSHDRTDLLPLKAGVSIMALGAMSANPDVKVQIVPVGMSYFHAHRFRSRAVVEFGTPIEIPQQLVRDFEKGSEDKKQAISKMMDLVYDGLKSVTLRAPDYDTLQVIQAARRLYQPPHEKISLGSVVELNKRFITGYLKYEQEPKVKALKAKVLEYNKRLRYLGLKDHQVDKADRSWWRALMLMCFRAGLVTGWGVLALPGVILNAPMFIAASIISHKKAKEALAASTVKIAGRDVLATWKVLVALGLAPPLYITYVALSMTLALRYNVPRKYVYWMPVALVAVLPSIAYSALKFGEVGMDVYKSLPPLFLSLTGNQKQLDGLRRQRQELSEEVHECIAEFAPQIWEDFDQYRIIQYPSAEPLLSKKKTNYGTNDLMNHPLSWLDERLFGWSQYDTRRSSKATRGARTASDTASEGARTPTTPSGYTTETNDGDDEGDFDSVVSILGSMSGVVGGSGSGSKPRSRRSSRGARTKSSLDLTKTDETTTATSSAVEVDGSSTTAHQR